MLAVDVDRNKTQFVGTDGTSGPVVQAIPPPSRYAGVYVTFHLGPAQSKEGTAASVPFLNGALHLMWTGPSQTKPAPPAHPTAVRPSTGLTSAHVGSEGSGDIADAIGSAVAKLPSASQSQVRQARSLTSAKVQVHALASPGPVKIISEPPPAPPIKARAVKIGTATDKLARDAAQMKALCAASNNAPAGLPAGVCKTAAANHP